MLMQSFFHLDCKPVIPECGFQCDKCIEEIHSVFAGMDGVSGVSKGKCREIDGIVVQYDSEAIGSDDLMKTFRTLPSFYKGRFVPELVTE
jgi:hypothetical protein